MLNLQTTSNANKRLRVVGAIWEFLESTVLGKTKKIVLVGGAGSGKSYTVAQFLLNLVHEYDDLSILITRKYNTTLRYTTIPLMHELMRQLEIEYLENKSEQILVFPTGSTIRFLGLDDPEKIKSAEFNIVWMEEATEFEYEDYLQLTLRLRRRNKHGVNKLILTFNPISKASWIYKEFFLTPQPDVRIHRSTYQDNPFLTADFIRSLKKLIEQDERFYRVYALGEWADIGKQVYTNYVVQEIHGDFSDKVVYGLDFGYINPTALVKVAITGDSIYVLDEFYRSYLTNSDLIAELKRQNVGKHIIVCDSAEPARIKELQLAGFNAVPASKANLLHEIDMIKRFKIVIDPKCVNFIKEIESYSWRTDKNGNTLEEPVKFNDHLMDAMRYAVTWALAKKRTPARTGKVDITARW